MGVVRKVEFKIVGQVPDDARDTDYEVLKAELALICAKYGLELEEE